MDSSDLIIHQTQQFSKTLKALQKAGKNEQAAARRAKRIITLLQRNPLDTEAANKRTHHGELRLDKCRKYDLACGYRLIAIKRKGTLIFSYIGSHDNCQRWLINNRNNQDEIDSSPLPTTVKQEEAMASVTPEPFAPERDEYEEQLLARIDEKMVMEIFSGLRSTFSSSK